MKNVLIITTSLRDNSNSDALAAEFAAGARDAGNDVEIVSLRDKTIGFCTGCLSCQETQVCALGDDANAIVAKMLVADVLVFATPIYYYGMSGQMKTLLDRANPLFPADYAFRDVYLLTTSADRGVDAPVGTEDGLGGWISCFSKAKLTETLHAGGVEAPGDIGGHAALRQAYAMGQAV